MDAKTIVHCSSCSAELDEPAGLTLPALPPCPSCGSLDRKTTVGVGGSVHIAWSTAGAVQSVDATVQLQTIAAKATFPTPQVIAETADDLDLENLPREVISEVLRLGLNILPPEDGKWPVEVTGFGTIAYIEVNDLSDSLLGAMAYIEGLVLRWHELLGPSDG